LRRFVRGSFGRNENADSAQALAVYRQ
jgi:hypothetical protein